MNAADKKSPMSARIWHRTQEDLASLGKEEGFAPTTLLAVTADLLAGYYTHDRCGTHIPVEFGDLSGRPLRDWISQAALAARYQKCNDHHPVRIGAECPSQPSPSSGTGGEAATRGEGDAGERTEPPAPVPAQGRKTSRQAHASLAADLAADDRTAVRQREAAPSLVGAESTPASTVQHLAAKVEEIAPGTVLFQQPGAQRVVTAEVPREARRRPQRSLADDCRHPLNMRNGDICGRCHQTVGRKK